MTTPSAQPETGPSPSRYLFRLYVTGNSPRSTLAIKNAKRLLDQFLEGQFDLEIIDIYLQPETAVSAQIVAVPTLVKVSPGSVRRVIGDLSDPARVVAALEVHVPGVMP
jgi:circadian clock protein KaiB